MGVKELREELLRNREVINTDLQNWDVRTRPSMEGAINVAKSKAASLEAKLAREVLNGSVSLVLMNDIPNIEALQKDLTSNSSTNIVIDFLGLDKELVNQAFTGIKGYPINNEFVVKMNNLLSDVADYIGAESMPSLNGGQNLYRTCANKEEVVSLVHNLLTNTYGTELKQHYLATKVSDLILQNLESDQVALIFTNVPSEFKGALLNYTGRAVTVGGENNADAMVQISADDNAESLTKKILASLNKTNNKKTRTKKQGEE